MSRPGKGNKAPIFSCSPLRPSPGPGRLQVSLFPPNLSRFSAQLSEPPPPAKKRRVGLEGEGAGGACGRASGGPGTPRWGAPLCLSLSGVLPAPKGHPWRVHTACPSELPSQGAGRCLLPSDKKGCVPRSRVPSRGRHSPVCQPARKS